MKKAVIAWGRMNPVTSGHEKLVNKVVSVAKRERAEPRIYLSHTQSAKKDPLQYKDKIAMAKKAFGTVMKQSASRTLIQLMQELQKAGFTEVTMVAGSDRVREYDTLLNKYNGKDYSFDKIKVVSAGERDPDAEGAAGMSATKLRKAAADGDEKTFMTGVPSKMSNSDAKKLYRLVRKGLLVEEINRLDEEELELFTDEELEEFVNEVEDWEELDEEYLEERAPLTLQQRIKKARVMKRLAPKLKRQREIKKFRMAPTERLVQRARKLARNLLRKKMAGKRGEKYQSLTPSAKIQVDTLIQKKASSVERIAKRLLPMVRKKEIERIRSARTTKKESIERLETQFNVLSEQRNPNMTAANKRIDQHNKRDERLDKQSEKRDKARYDRIRDRARLRDTMQRNTSTKAEQALQLKANKNSIDFEIIQEVYNRGVEAWNNKPKSTTTAEQWGFARVNTFIADYKSGKENVDNDLFEGGLWDNIHKKRERIKKGSGERMRKPGEKGAPTAQDFKDASEGAFSRMAAAQSSKADRTASTNKLKPGLDTFKKKPAEENFQDGKNPQDKGDAARHGLKGKTKAQLKKIRSSKTASKRKKQLAHWMINMHHNEEVNLDESLQIEKGAGVGTFLTAADLGMKIKAGYADHPSVEEEHGAGEEGTDKLAKKYKKDTPGQ